jgi:dihydrofolate reductase
VVVVVYAVLEKMMHIKKFDRDGPAAGDETTPAPILAPSLNAALSHLGHLPSPFTLRNIFIVGGASIYTQALQHPDTARVLLTRVVEPAYEDCDVFFPEIREGGEWVQALHADLVEWVGFDVPEGVQEEKGTRYEFQMWVRNEGAPV